MVDRTKQLVGALLNAPGILEFLKRDPSQIVTALANCRQGQAMIRAGTRAIGELLNRSVPSPHEQGATLHAESALVVAPAVHDSGPPFESSSVPIVGVTSLAAITGCLVVVGTVSMMALSRREN